MFLAAGIILFIISLAIIFAIIFTTVRTIKNRGELVISKKNLIYLAPTFVLIYLLHLSARLYNGGALNFFSYFALLGSVLEVITKFKVDTDLVLPICNAYPVYYAAFILAYIAGGAAVILSIASFFSPRIRNFFSIRRTLHGGCDIVIGDCADSLKYAKANKNSLLFISDISRARYAELIKSGYTVARGSLKDFDKKLGKGEYNLILFSSANIPYTQIIEQFLAIKSEGRAVTLNMEANQKSVKVIKERLIAETDGKEGAFINCFSKHELIARQFVVQYPITKFIPRSFYNKNYSIKPDKDINVVFIGFGKMNYQLFRMCSMQFQFATQTGGKLESKPVHYYIYDHKDEALHNEFFSRILYEFEEDFKDCDFPRPEKICDIAEVSNIDINSVAAKRKFKGLVAADSFTYFIISLNTDLEDASYAQTIKRILPNGDNYRIFVRTKSNAENFGDDGIIYFGDESKIYTHGSIVNDDLSEFARRLNMLYDNIQNMPEWLVAIRHLPAEQQGEALEKSLSDPSHCKLMRENWESRPMIEQASNLYHALNLPFKLNLLGFDMVKCSDGNKNGITETEFNKRYVNTGKADNYADINFFSGLQSSNVLAFIEHSRWNALYILYDYKQMKKKDIVAKREVEEDGSVKITAPHKNIALKQHACLTTYYGLKELIEYKFSVMYPGEKIEGVSPTDVRLRELYNLYQYDYMDLDRLYSEITAMGYKIVENF